MEFRIYDRQTLAYKDGGYVASYTIDDDYVVNNNSTITIVKPLNDKVIEGDTIVLIKTSGAYHKGTINTFDNSDLKITYKADKELFNNNMLNPQRTDFIDEVEDGERVYTSFGLDYVADVLKAYFANANDQFRTLPIKVYTDGDVLGLTFDTELQENSKLAITTFYDKTFTEKAGELEKGQKYTFRFNGANWVTLDDIEEEVDLAEYGIITNEIALENDKIIISMKDKMVWTWGNDQINFVDWFVDLFEKYNVAVKWSIDFDIAKKLEERHPYYIVTISALSNSPKLIKDNVNETMQMITYTDRQQPEATVCTLIDKEDKEIINICSGKNLLNPNLAKKGKFLSVDKDYGFEQETDDITSNISGLIKVQEGHTYIISCNEYDNKVRTIVAYKNKNDIQTSVSYKLEYDDNVEKYKYGITVQEGFDIKYLKICYYNGATEVQLCDSEAEQPLVYDAYNQPAIYYLCEKNGNYYVSLNQDESEVGEEEGVYYKKPLRVLPSKMKIVTYDEEGDNTPEQCAKDTLVPSKFNQAIEVQLSSDSKMFDFSSSFGNYYKIINKNGTIDSVYTGRKETSNDKWITLYFGLGRQNYTDLIQMRYRKNKYQVLYNKGEPL